jgi:hypothetical protein
MTDDQFYEVWNRACAGGAGASALEGDVALQKMLLGHGCIMNGGLQHFGDLSAQEQDEAIGGFRFFSFHEIADLVMRVPGMSAADLDDAQNAYIEFDSAMLGNVRSHIEANPHQFSSV